MTRKINGFPIYRTYSFTGQDPAVRETLNCVKDKKDSSKKSGVARSTYRNWDTRKTRRPQFATLQATAIANGKRWKLGDDD